MDDFYNKIKNSVDGIPEVKPSKNSWNSFQSFRDEKSASPIKPFPWLLVSTLGLIAMLLGSNIYWATRSFDQSIGLTSSSLASIHDTIYITKVIDNGSHELINTIISLEADLQQSKLSFAAQNAKYRTLESQFFSRGSKLNDLQTKYEVQESKLSLFANANDEWSRMEALSLDRNAKCDAFEIESADRDFASFMSLPRLSADELIFNRSEVLHPSNIIWIKNEKPFNLLEAITPKSLSLNINTGIQAGFGSRYDRSNGLFHELRAVTNFTKKMRGYLGVSLYKGHKDFKGDLNYPNMPFIVVPEGQELKEYKVAQSIVGLNIGLEYMIQTATKWRPHVGLGYAQSIMNKDHFSFELKSPQGEYYISPEGGVNQALLRQMLFSLGADYNFRSTIDFRSAVTFYQGLSSSAPSYINLTAGAYYHF